MGHERIGYLPKSKKWRAIVDQIGSYSSGNNSIAQLASQTTKNVRHRFKNIEEDSAVFSAFKYLILLAHASTLAKPSEFLSRNKIDLPETFNLFDLATSIQEYISKNEYSKEYSTFATQALVDTVSEWSRINQIQQRLIFDSNNNSFEVWRKAADGSGFCELSRTFFAKFTERYLRYFLEREASCNINSLSERILFSKNIEQHVSQISKHAFETAKITESFAAGWYNSHAKGKIPTDRRLQGFLSFAFQKINSEIIREENSE